VARFFVDVDVAVAIGQLLAAGGHDVEFARDLGLGKAGDEQILGTATQRAGIPLTHNIKDFSLLHRAWRLWSAQWGVRPAPLHAGILGLEQIDASLHGQMIQQIEGLVASRASVTNELHAWSRAHGWRQP
jgi:hypothetical protein